MLEKKYPKVIVDLTKLAHNIDEIVGRCMEQGIEVAGVVKGFNGISETLDLYETSRCTAIASSRLEHLEEAKRKGLASPLMAIRIPMRSEVVDLVRLADMSLNSEVTVIDAINEECLRARKRHGIILMADLGDLREGFYNKEELIQAALHTERLAHVDLLGIGTNLGCYGSINATPDKMEELAALAESVEDAIGRELAIVSGGGTTSFPLVYQGTMPKKINHLRIGEGIAVGKDLQDLWNIPMPFLYTDIFKLQAEIVEIKDKPSYPVGEIFVDCFGGCGNYVDRGIRKRGILAVGKVDFALDSQLKPLSEGVEVLGSSSDHLIVDLEDSKEAFQVGDVMEFELRYSTMVFLTSSPYVKVEIR
jgi:predicted amino acid racemase